MKPTVCLDCQGPIEKPRHGKKFCSDACKQSYYRKNKPQPTMENETENSKEEILLLNFKKSEFDEFKSWCKEKGIKIDLIGNDDDLESYCFFRKDLLQMRSFEEIVNYYNEKPEEWAIDLWQNPESDQAKEFKNFKAYFEDDRVKFLE